MPQDIIVIALGGNAILQAGQRGTIKEQLENVDIVCGHLVEIISNKRCKMVITHGNGPQIGNVLLQNEMASSLVPPMPLDVCGAATEGMIGYMIQQTLANHLREAGIKHNITTVVTQVIVDKDDPAFKNPTKPIGPFYSLNEAEKLRREKGWKTIEDSARGYRRLVPSPRPVNIQQARIINSMLDAGEIVVAAGGGGIPVIRGEKGNLRGVEAVIDKDYVSSRLAIEIDADVIFYLTSVEKVCRDFGLPSQRALDHLTLNEAKVLLAEGQFGTGSMEPKIRGAIEFLEETDKSQQLSFLPQEREVIITLPETAVGALQGKTGTRITR